MTLQWFVVALILYIEIAIVLLFLLPWIRPSLLDFQSFAQWEELRKFYGRNTSFHQFLSFVPPNTLWSAITNIFDAVREVRKYAAEVQMEAAIRHTADADNAIHMRLFRAQRNLYISGFALLLFLVIKRISALLSRCALLEAASEAAMKQAQSASKTAKSFMEGDTDLTNELQRRLNEIGHELKSTQNDRDAMKQQAEGLQREYDRVCEKLSALEDLKGDKKKD